MRLADHGNIFKPAGTDIGFDLFANKPRGPVIATSNRSAGSSINFPTGGHDHCLQHGFHELTLGPDELCVLQAYLLAARDEGAVISWLGIVDNLRLRANPLLALAGSAEEPLAKAHDRAAVIP